MDNLGVIEKVIVFLLFLGVLVFFHELGHFLAAKLFRMRVLEFAFNLGPKLLRLWHDGQTEYTVRLIPLGGFVRIAGMEIEDAAERRLTSFGDRRREATDSRAQQAAAGAGESAAESTNVALMQQETRETDGADPDGFNSRSIFQRFMVILAGPAFSFLLGWLLLCSIGVVYGISPPSTRIEEVTPGDPAARAGLKAGDTIVAIDGAPVTQGKEMIRIIRSSPERPLRLGVRSPGATTAHEVAVVPRRGVADGKEAGLIGIATGQLPPQRVSLAESIQAGNREFLFFFQMMLRLFQSGRVKDEVGGPIAIFQGTSKAVEVGGSLPLKLLANLSLSLGLFNLFPIPILDGGHLLLLTVEKIRGRKLTADQMQRVLTTGLAIILVLFVWVMFKDISRLLG